MPGTTHKVASFKDPNIERQVVELVRGINAAIPSSEKGQPNGVATLDSNGKVPDSQIPDGITRDTELAAHTDRTDNPHQVTAAQVGAVSKAGDTMTGPLEIVNQFQALILEGNSNNEIKFYKPNAPSGKRIITMMVDSDGNFNFMRRNDDNTWKEYLLRITSNNELVMGAFTVWHAGNDGAGSGLDADMLDGYHASYFQPASDERLKTDIQPLADALSKVLSLRGVSFVWNDKAQEVGANRQTLAGREIGLLAGEVAQVVPEVILDWVETPDGEKYKTVDSARLVALLVEAIKELNAKVDALEERVVNAHVPS